MFSLFIVIYLYAVISEYLITFAEYSLANKNWTTLESELGNLYRLNTVYNDRLTVN